MDSEKRYITALDAGGIIVCRSTSHVARAPHHKHEEHRRFKLGRHHWQYAFRWVTPVQDMLRWPGPGAWQTDQTVFVQGFYKCRSPRWTSPIASSITCLSLSLSTSTSSACRSGGPLPPRRKHFGSARNVIIATISPGLGFLGWPPIQASLPQTCSCSTSHYVDRCPVVIAAVSTIIFTIIVYLSSFVTSACLSLFEQGVSEDSYFSYYFSPIDTFKDLVSSTLSILNDEFGIIELHEGFRNKSQNRPTPLPTEPDAIIIRLVKKFILGLPLVGIGSLIQMILSMPFLGPVHWIARYRSSRGRRGSSRDMTAIIVIVLMVIGALRFIYPSLKLHLCLNTEHLLFYIQGSRQGLRLHPEGR